MPKISAKVDAGSPPAGAPDACGVGQNQRLSTNTGYIWKTAKDRHIVSIKVE